MMLETILRVLNSVVGVNLISYSITSKKTNTTATIYVVCQLCLMVFLLANFYMLTISIQNFLIKYMPENDISLWVSATILIIAIILGTILPFVFGYYFNRYAMRQLNKLK